MRILLVILILSELIIGYLILGAPAFYDSRGLAQAVADYYTSPSPATEAELSQQRHIAHSRQRLLFLVFALILAANSYALVRTARCCRKASPVTEKSV